MKYVKSSLSLNVIHLTPEKIVYSYKHLAFSTENDLSYVPGVDFYLYN